MARITHEAGKEYDSQGGFEVFTLENDQDSKKVQFMINSVDDVLAYSCHGVAMKSPKGRDYERKVSCLKTSKHDPEGVCPMCDANIKVFTARFIPLYSIEDDKPLLWERGAKFIDTTIKGFANRIAANGRSLPSLVVEIVRNGKKGDTQTTYIPYPMETAKAKDISQLEMPDPEGSLIATWSDQEMKQYLRDGTVPSGNSSNVSNEGVQRRESRVAPPVDMGERPDVSRGTPTDAPEQYF